MTSDPTPPGNKPDDGALDDAALEVSGGAAPQGSAAPAPFKRDTAWAQAGVDHAASMMNSHLAGQPDAPTNGAHVSVSPGFSAPGGGWYSVTAGAAPVNQGHSNISIGGFSSSSHSASPPVYRNVGIGNAPSGNAPFSHW